jgi:hypothetical protein
MYVLNIRFYFSDLCVKYLPSVFLSVCKNENFVYEQVFRAGVDKIKNKLKDLFTSAKSTNIKLL